MARAFLQEVAQYIFTNYEDKVENLCIVLPNKRAALFLKQHLARAFGKTIWLPEITSAEDFVEELSGLKNLEEIDLICHLYESYQYCYGKDAEPFDSFVKWGQLILQDFNEIDRYLADPAQLYENLKDIKVIENWSLAEENLTEHQNNYLRFMSSLGAIYRHFTAFLLKNNWSYQGLAYRQAVEKCASSAYPLQFHKILFCGFNALNAAELKIFNYYLRQDKGEILWDADKYYLEDANQEAGLFLRKNFEFFAQKNPSFIEENFREQKNIDIISVPKQMGQAQAVKQCLEQLINNSVPLDRVAVVLANEKMLWPVLQQLPEKVKSVNITMEYPVKYSATFNLVEQIIQIQTAFSRQTRQHKTLYHKDLMALLRQPVFKTYAEIISPSLQVNQVIDEIANRNLSFITQGQLQKIFGANYEELNHLFHPVASGSNICVLIRQLLEKLIEGYAGHLGTNHRRLEMEYLQILVRNFNRLEELITRYPQFNDMNSFRQLFMQVVGSSTVPFIGEPLTGLQIMGVLETRTLDFEHIILVSVNEGVLPSGKSINSFIPNDLKRAFGLPLYLEKDAIYAYHFYRLLQKAKTCSIIYDSETDTFGKGEKSRFVTQLQLELQEYNPLIKITEKVAAYSTFPETPGNEITVKKNRTNLNAIISKATSSEKYGSLSPSGLITFKDCSLKFYLRYGVHIKETEEVEESAEANTFGSILHLSLENLYKDLTGKIIHADDLKSRLPQIADTVDKSFISFFESVPTGKAILQKEVITVYVTKLVKNDLRYIEDLKKENQYLTLHGLEQEFSASLSIPFENRTQIIYVKGKIDRIDISKGIYRIIDYKSSVKETDKFVFTDFDSLFHDKNYDKQLQLLIYAWLIYKNNLCTAAQLQPAIVPFKVFSEAPKYILGSDKKPVVLTADFLNEFEKALAGFIAGIFEMEIPFHQTTDRKICDYCAYNVVCNFHP